MSGISPSVAVTTTSRGPLGQGATNEIWARPPRNSHKSMVLTNSSICSILPVGTSMVPISSLPQVKATVIEGSVDGGSLVEDSTTVGAAVVVGSVDGWTVVSVTDAVAGVVVVADSSPLSFPQAGTGDNKEGQKYEQAAPGRHRRKRRRWLSEWLVLIHGWLFLRGPSGDVDRRPRLKAADGREPAKPGFCS